jgi:tRNA nucleotidyltransferase (CCA-adding enzyme)
VRDALLGRLGPTPDLDLVVPGGAIALSRRLAGTHGGHAVVLDAERDMARLVRGPWTIDFAARCGPDLSSDLRRRDYRINAMAVPLAAGAPLEDPCGGLVDLCEGRLRAVGETNLLEDPLRLLRGPRLMAELGLPLEATTVALLRRHAGALTGAAPERVLAELEKLAAAEEGADQALELAIALGLLQPWLAPLDPSCTASPLGQRALDLGLVPEERALALPLARLAGCFGAQALARLRASRRWQQRVGRLRHWARALADGAPLAEQAQLQLCRDLEHDLPALVLLRPEATRGWLQRWRQPEDPLFHPRAALDGRLLQQQLGLAPGPVLGQLLEALALERAFGRPADLTAARRWCDATRVQRSGG